MHVYCWKEIEEWSCIRAVMCSCNVQDYITEELGNILSDVKANGVDIALRVTKEDFVKGGDAYLRKVASLQQYIFGAPFHKYFQALLSGNLAGLQPKIMHFFSNESM